jgi:queuosine precursor transporter
MIPACRFSHHLLWCRKVPLLPPAVTVTRLNKTGQAKSLPKRAAYPLTVVGFFLPVPQRGKSFTDEVGMAECLLLQLPNEVLWLCMLLANFIGILIAYQLFGQTGLYIWIPIATILANIQVLKMVDLLAIGVTLGNITYATSFLVTDILSENYGRKAARKAVYIGFFSLIVTVVIMNIALSFKPNDFDFIQESLNNIFTLLPRIALASLIAYGVSQLHDVWAYNAWKNLFPDERFLWLRNNASTMVSQLIDSALFTFIAFWGLLPQAEFMQILVTTYLLKWLVAVADTPFLYLARTMFRRQTIQPSG